MKLSKVRWKSLWLRMGGNSNHGTVFDLIVSSYTEPHRFYHNDKHISDCLDAFDSTAKFSESPDALEASIWFHDIVYDIQAADNEEKSAEMAEALLKDGGISPALCHDIHNLILYTKIKNEPDDTDSKLLKDIDLSIFGKPEKEYDQYENDIRKEYAWISDEFFIPARKEILMSFLNMESIYYSKYFQNQYEERARKNLLRAIGEL